MVILEDLQSTGQKTCENGCCYIWLGILNAIESFITYVNDLFHDYLNYHLGSFEFTLLYEHFSSKTFSQCLHMFVSITCQHAIQEMPKLHAALCFT